MSLAGYSRKALVYCTLCTAGLAAGQSSSGLPAANLFPELQGEQGRESSTTEQESPVVQQSQTTPAAPVQQNPCIQPARIFIAENYTGPFRRTVKAFARKPEIRTAQVRRGSGLPICTLRPSQKFHLFVKDTVNPVTFIVAGFNSGIAQAENDDPTFGQGAEGYGKRYAAAFADEASSNFFHTFAFPVIFRQDPRYYRQGYGTGGSRFGHALTHVFVARADGGGPQFNYSEWLGTISSVALSNTYHPGNDRGVGPACGRIAASVATDMGFDVLREFWPEIVRKLKLPFRVEQPPPKN